MLKDLLYSVHGARNAEPHTCSTMLWGITRCEKFCVKTGLDQQCPLEKLLLAVWTEQVFTLDLFLLDCVWFVGRKK